MSDWHLGLTMEGHCYDNKQLLPSEVELVFLAFTQSQEIIDDIVKESPLSAKCLKETVDIYTKENTGTGKLNYIWGCHETNLIINMRVCSKRLAGGVPHGSQNPEPISDQNILFFMPLFRPDPENLTPFQT